MPAQSKQRGVIDALEAIVGADAVLHRPEDMLVFEYDGSIDRALPQAVVFPRSTDEVAQVVRLARRHGIPVVPRGAGTGLSGGAIAVQGGIVIALTRMNRILEIDPANRIAVVEPGVVNITLSHAAARYGLHYVPDPSSQKTCTIGGNIAENSGGPHTLAYGVTTNHVLGLEVVLPDGETVWLGARGQDAPGYDLMGLFVGSEGTLGIATKIVVKLAPDPEAVRTLLAIFDEMDQATGAVSAIIASGVVPAALEIMDRLVLECVGPSAGYPTDAGAVLLIEVEGLRESVAEESAAIEALCDDLGAREVRAAESPQERERLWAGRKGAFGSLGRLAPNYYVLDGVVPRTRLPEVLRKVGEIARRFSFPIANVFHAGDGNLHPCIAFDERVPGESQRVLEAGAEVMRLCIEAGGTITGEHGVGIEKQSFMELIFSEEDLDAMEKARAAFVGEAELFNPCKIFPSGAGCGDGWRLPRLPEMGPDGFI